MSLPKVLKDIFENEVNYVVDEFNKVLKSENSESKAIYIALLAKQWEKGYNPQNYGEPGELLRKYYLVMNQGADGFGWSELADAVFKKLGCKREAV